MTTTLTKDPIQKRVYTKRSKTWGKKVAKVTNQPGLVAEVKSLKMLIGTLVAQQHLNGKTIKFS